MPLFLLLAALLPRPSVATEPVLVDQCISRSNFSGLPADAVLAELSRTQPQLIAQGRPQAVGSARAEVLAAIGRADPAPVSLALTPFGIRS